MSGNPELLDLEAWRRGFIRVLDALIGDSFEFEVDWEHMIELRDGDIEVTCEVPKDSNVNVLGRQQNG